ncbi:methionine synthase [Candidatus Berkiella aquae]
MSDKSKKSDDRFDAFTAVFLIAVAVGGVVYWLSGLPS